jgi:serine/threonine-protein phosphatase 2A activator
VSLSRKLSSNLLSILLLTISFSYLRVVRHLILTYTLEPAGSHGVWGLDDHFFLSYIFGSAQYCPPITDYDAMPVEDSLPSAPNPGDVVKQVVVERERKHNMYFSAVGFINDVKTGPFWEHSPILFDISGVRSGWGKINKV